MPKGTITKNGAIATGIVTAIASGANSISKKRQLTDSCNLPNSKRNDKESSPQKRLEEQHQGAQQLATINKMGLSPLSQNPIHQTPSQKYMQLERFVQRNKNDWALATTRINTETAKKLGVPEPLANSIPKIGDESDKMGLLLTVAGFKPATLLDYEEMDQILDGNDQLKAKNGQILDIIPFSEEGGIIVLNRNSAKETIQNNPDLFEGATYEDFQTFEKEIKVPSQLGILLGYAPENVKLNSSNPTKLQNTSNVYQNILGFRHQLDFGQNPDWAIKTAKAVDVVSKIVNNLANQTQN